MSAVQSDQGFYERIILVLNKISILLNHLFLVMWKLCTHVWSFTVLFLI